MADKKLAPIVSRKPRAMPDRDKPKLIGSTITGEDGQPIDLQPYTNPITRLGQTQGSEFRYVDATTNAHGAYMPPQEVGGVDYLGGPALNTDVNDIYSEYRPDKPPVNYNDVTILGTGGTNPQTGAHEFMHRGLNIIRGDYTEDELAKLTDKTTASLILDPRYEHFIVQAVLEKAGGDSRNDYMEGFDQESRDKINAAADSLYKLSEESTKRRGYYVEKPHGKPKDVYKEEGGLFSSLMKAVGFSDGGVVKQMDNQMNTLMAEGGLKTDGATVDPVSGNEVPAGSNPIEVRDTIDAKLSDGEYVVPADVVKFFGVQFFEKLREKAKIGLEDMNKDGRIGGEPVEEEGEDDESLPFSVEELQAMDDAEGMDVQMQQSGFAVGGVATADEIAAQRSTFNPASMPIGFSAFGTQAPQQAATQAPTSSKVYYNSQGLTVVIPLDANGNPTIPIPDGYSATPPQAAQPNNPDKSGDYAGKIGVGGTVDSTGTSSRLKKEDFASPEAVKASVIKDLDSLKTAGTVGKVGGALVGGGIGAGLGGALGAGTQIAEARAKIQVAEAYGWDMSEEKKLVEDTVDKMGFGSKTIIGKVAPGTGLASGYLKKNPVPTTVRVPSTSAGVKTASAMTPQQLAQGQAYANKGSDRSDTWAGGSVSKSTAAGGATQKAMTASQKQAQSKAAADKLGTSLATRGKARGGLMKTNKAK